MPIGQTTPNSYMVPTGPGFRGKAVKIKIVFPALERARNLTFLPKNREKSMKTHLLRASQVRPLCFDSSAVNRHGMSQKRLGNKLFHAPTRTTSSGFSYYVRPNGQSHWGRGTDYIRTSRGMWWASGFPLKKKNCRAVLSFVRLVVWSG